jgi:hypothetical protein
MGDGAAIDDALSPSAAGHCIQLRINERAVIFEVRGLVGRTEVQSVHDFSPSNREWVRII